MPSRTRRRPTPELTRMPAQHQRLLPAVRELFAPRVGHGVVGRPELTEENKVALRFAGPPCRKPLLPPGQKSLEPDAVLREADRHLDLVACGDPALKRV